EGAPKQMIDMYKQVLVGQLDSEDEEPGGAADAQATDETAEKEKAHGALQQNPETLEYGSHKAEITEYGITDENGLENSTITKGSECTFHMTVRFAEDIAAPIFAVSVKNIYGVEITGTNTMVEKAFLEPVAKGEAKHITFRQRIDLQGGEYLLSFGVTGFEQQDFTVYHRLYDVLSLTVVSDKNTVGYYDMNSTVEVR
ncbi:MAG: Wzt carbohydrate-binding domain-containing protein, partial [Lachnospiraceae bacterium]|nr:Wzt carbohydrate-binding domain-containing protein [Lachnospiraceae bacterium]